MAGAQLQRRVILFTSILGALLQASLAFPDWTGAIDVPNWSEGAIVPSGGRPNPYNFSPNDLGDHTTNGKLHALVYPVSVTGILIPERPVKNILEAPDSNPLRYFILELFKEFTDIRSLDQVTEMVGLHPYPQPEDQGVYSVPYPGGVRPNFRMGYSLLNHNGVSGFTVSCASCHVGNLFGKSVLGMTNRFPHANEVFVSAKNLLKQIDPTFFQIATEATAAETEMFQQAKSSLRWVEGKNPAGLGLDTSLAQVALSLSHRSLDAYATKTERNVNSPRREVLRTEPADSKPAVWWNVKYKNRWLSDGSVVSGNPIFTNFIWNEIGRGADLKSLETWLSQNESMIDDLTTAVFSSQSPRVTDFFPAASINLVSAKKGEKHFILHCSGCHGVYEKAWSQGGSEGLPLIKKLETLKVSCPERTPVVDVGTDPMRYKGMESLARGLNPLSISKKNGIIIRTQKGYVPPPLVGIWARWPYFHNNSVPSLCALLTRAEGRPKSYYSGEAINPATDFDLGCNGYPLKENTPREWRQHPEHLFRTNLKGLSNQGHDEGIFLSQGRELLTHDEKRELIQFLQTL